MTMKRWIIDAASAPGIDGLRLEEAPLPEPGPGEVRVRVRAVSLNYRDQLIVNRMYGLTFAHDFVPVSDGAGEIDAVGPGAGRWKVGDRVTGLYFKDWNDGPPHPSLGWGLGSPGQDGMLAEYVVLPQSRLARMPDTLGFAESATLPCAGLTAWTALHAAHPLVAGQKLLALGTGGVSLFALLLGRAAGARVIMTTSREENVARLRALGAADVIDYRTTPSWGDVVFERTGGVHKVVNAAGGHALNQAIAALGYYDGEIAQMGLFGAGDGPVAWPVLMSKGGSVRGTAVGHAASYERLVDAIDTNAIKPVIGKRFAFDAAKEAYRAQTDPSIFGKIVIDVTPPSSSD